MRSAQGMEHRLLCGDFREWAAICDNRPGVLVFDPPYDNTDLMAERFDAEFEQVLAFGDGLRAGTLANGWSIPLRWLFIWDGGSSWWVSGRPLARMKCCWWLASLDAPYREDGWFVAPQDQTEHVVTNSRGTYLYSPDPRGKHLSDVFTMSLANLHAEGPSHAKPLDWVTALIANCTHGDVLDPFCGSGVSLIACERLGRTCYAVDKDASQCDVAKVRWEGMTGQAATLGKTS